MLPTDQSDVFTATWVPGDMNSHPGDSPGNTPPRNSCTVRAVWNEFKSFLLLLSFASQTSHCSTPSIKWRKFIAFWGESTTTRLKLRYSQSVRFAPPLRMPLQNIKKKANSLKMQKGNKLFQKRWQKRWH